MGKNDFGNKLTTFNKRITSRKKRNSPITEDYNSFLGRIYLTCNDGSQNMFLYQATLDALELKKDKGTDYA